MWEREKRETETEREREIKHSVLYLILFPFPSFLFISFLIPSLRRRNLKGLEVLINLTGSSLGNFLPQLLSCLGAPIRDEDTGVRTGMILFVLEFIIRFLQCIYASLLSPLSSPSCLCIPFSDYLSAYFFPVLLVSPVLSCYILSCPVLSKPA